jgi:hypothetical protein
VKKEVGTMNACSFYECCVCVCVVQHSKLEHSILQISIESLACTLYLAAFEVTS